MQIKYVGTKPRGETAFSHITKMPPWMIGESRDIVDEKLAAQMLKHPDVFVQDGAATPTAKGSDIKLDLTPGVSVPPLAKTFRTADGDVVLDGLDAAALHVIAKAAGVKVHPFSGAAKVIKALVDSLKPVKK